MKIGGTPGLALTVTDGEDVIYEKTIGYSDESKKELVTKDTVFPICSLSKAFTTAALGILVHEGKLSWDTRIIDILPDYLPPDSTLHDQLTVEDCLSHRSGMAWADNLVIGSAGNVLVPGRDGLRYVSTQTRLLPFRGVFAYNNLPYELAAQVLEKISGVSWQEFVQKRLLDVLGLKNTYLREPPSATPNVATCYNALEDAKAVPIPCIQAGNDRFAGPSGGIRSTTADLACVYKEFVRSLRDQYATGKTSTKNSPFCQVAQLTSGRIAMTTPSLNEATYALGWGRVQLPGSMGQIGINPGLLPDGSMPVVGKGVSSPPLVIFHQGSWPGALSFVALLPDRNMTVNVLSNSLALHDVADWVGQMVIEELICVPPAKRIDALGLARKAVKANRDWFPQLKRELDEGRANGSASPQVRLEAYTGTYWDDAKIVKINVTLEDSGKTLYWTLQDRATEKYALTHYRDDVFTWLQPRNELSQRGRWVGSDQGPEFWKLYFQVNAATGSVDAVQWAHDTGVPPIVFKKQASKL